MNINFLIYIYKGTNEGATLLDLMAGQAAERYKLNTAIKGRKLTFFMTFNENKRGKFTTC